MIPLYEHPEAEVAAAELFLKNIFTQQDIYQVVIAVSGGIDSALALTLLARTLPKNKIWPVLLPFADQSTTDAETICHFNGVPKDNWLRYDIAPIVEAVKSARGGETTPVREGNLRARARMMVVFDIAKEKQALVCGTENKSEHYLGYFTRFGDAASDIEPLSRWYKTQVRQLASFLQLPPIFLEKLPSAGLWTGQTDENEMGFSYDLADEVLTQLIDQKKSEQEILADPNNGDKQGVQKILHHVRAMEYKLKVPYERP